MPARLPDLRVHDDRAIEADHVVARADVVDPPGVLDVPLELDAERAVVPEAVDPAVNLARPEDEPAPLAKRDELLHVHGRHRRLPFGRGASPWTGAPRGE